MIAVADDVHPDAQPPLQVFLVDDHEIVRDGLRRLLEDDPGITVVGEAGTVAEALAMLPGLRPDVAVIDGRLPDGRGVDIARMVRDQLPATRAMMLTSYDDDETLFDAIAAGVTGLLLKQVRGTDFVDAVRRVAAGQSMLHPAVTKRLMDRVGGRTSDEDALSGLTPRERRVLRGIGEGKTNREIADVLGVSEKTVKNHVTKLLGKLGLQRRTQAAVLASRLDSMP
jgi:two-component system, NarL family, response regulator DevR